MRLFFRLELEWKVLILAAVLFGAFVWPVQRFFISRLSETLTQSIDPRLEETLRSELTDASDAERETLREHIERYRQTRVMAPIIIREQQRLLIALSIGLFAIFLLIALWVLKYFTRPLKNLAVAVAKIGKDDSVKIVPVSGGALGVVEQTVANLQNELAVLREKDRIAGMETAWKDIARIMAHEIKNPLTPIRLTLDRIEERTGSGQELSSEELTKFLLRINGQVDMLERLVDQFRSFSRDPDLRITEVDITALIHSIADGMGQKITTTISGNCIMNSDPYLLQQIFLNIWKNSLEAGATAMNVNVHSDATAMTIVLQDNGPGIASGDVERIWLPYVTSKKSGTGLGLPVVKRLVEALSGTVSMSSDIGKGVLITITFPIELHKEQS
jgi:two-component system, NtrC family, nitrogen regulation sensor histidine kinase NtrY